VVASGVLERGIFMALASNHITRIPKGFVSHLLIFRHLKSRDLDSQAAPKSYSRKYEIANEGSYAII
jgi:hypothetical protein